MTHDDWSRRQTAQDHGRDYRVVRNAASYPGASFFAGETVRLIHTGYSRYDSSHVYQFETIDGERKAFWLHDGEPIERLSETFHRGDS